MRSFLSTATSVTLSLGLVMNPFIAAAQGVSGQLVELRLTDPSLSIVAQLAAFEEARRFLGGKLKLLNSPGT